MSLGAALARLTRDLRELDVRHALVGGLAVSVRAAPRFTQDLDVAVAVRDDVEAEALVRALASRGWAIYAVVEQEATGRLATVRLALPACGDALADLLFATCGIEAEIVAAATPLVVLGTEAPVARVADLAAMKVLSADDGRPEDRADLRRLWELLDHDGRADVLARLGVLKDRGFSRGQDLPEKLARLVGAQLDADV